MQPGTSIAKANEGMPTNGPKIGRQTFIDKVVAGLIIISERDAAMLPQVARDVYDAVVSNAPGEGKFRYALAASATKKAGEYGVGHPLYKAFVQAAKSLEDEVNGDVNPRLVH